MARPKRHDGVVFRRKGSKLWWMRYCDRNGQRHRESTLTEDWQEAQKRLRERLLARDDNVLEVVRRGEGLTFRTMGRTLSNKLFHSSSSSGEDTRCEHPGGENPECNLWDLGN